MYKIVDFCKSHLELMNMREHEAVLCSDESNVENLQACSVAKTGLVNGRIVCCFGYADLGDNTAEVWLIPSIYMNKMPVSFFREVKKEIDGFFNKFSKIQTHSIDDRLHNTWMKFIGFHKEIVLKDFLNGRDYIRWAKQKETN